MLEQSCENFQKLPAFTNMGVTLSYGELDQQSRDFGAYLQHEFGLSKGDRVAIMLPNLLQYPVALFSALRAGLVVVNVNPLYTPRELQHQLADSGAVAVVFWKISHTRCSSPSKHRCTPYHYHPSRRSVPATEKMSGQLDH